MIKVHLTSGVGQVNMMYSLMGCTEKSQHHLCGIFAKKVWPVFAQEEISGEPIWKVILLNAKLIVFKNVNDMKTTPDGGDWAIYLFILESEWAGK